ncbi:MAG: acyl-CoA dehydrogenase [Bacteroidales bacterium]|jgi:acyl-CoA dehydrogenase|nr:acyl-CoA dehydrogenase [Bacteroidales bacterium]
MILLNPKNRKRFYPDKRSEEIMAKTVAFFENKGKASIKKDDQERAWYQEFIDFIGKEEIFADLLTPAKYGKENSRWDMWRIQEFNEIIGFYGLPYWYVWQVTILGLGPIWMSDNEKAKEKAAKLLRSGSIFAFGLSEKDHGADVYSTSMRLSKQADGSYLANGSKYYIGNANKADMVSTFGKLDNDEYVFFAANYQHSKYDLVKNTVNSQNYVGEYALRDYPVSEDDVLATGQQAWDNALNTVNVGKYNLGWASIGMCTHAFYEAINHASKRNLYGMFVTDFPHVKRLFTDAYTRLVAMKLYASRTADYMRSASQEDRRYMLYDPIMKMKVTTQGEEVINLMWDVIAAKGFEKDTFFEMATRDIRALPKLEGTVHVNIALIIKFLQNFLYVPKEYADIPQRSDATDDTFLFNQGPTRGLGKIQFHDFNKALDLFDLPNIAIFRKQVNLFKETLMRAPATEEQKKNVDVMLTIGEMFTLVPYAQLILENAKIMKIDEVLIDQIFDFIVRDFSNYALELYNRPSSTEKQMEYCIRMIQKPAVDAARNKTIWKDYVYSNVDAYEMNP